MAMPTLRYGDGFPDIAPDLQDFVKILQLALKNLGYPVSTEGLFDRETEKVVISLQQSKGLTDDGIVRQSTWEIIARNIKVQKAPATPAVDTSAAKYPVLRYRDGYSTTSPHLSGSVKRLQTLLKNLGYSIFVDGLFNKTTEDAVKSFQKSVRQPDSGVVEETTWKALEQQSVTAKPGQGAYPDLKLWDGFASSNPHLRDNVKRLQEALRKLGYAVDVDGLFGLDTEDAVKDFQLANDLTTDGVVDKTTWQALEQTAGLSQFQKAAPAVPGQPSQPAPAESSSAAPSAISGYSAHGSTTTTRPTLKYKDGFPDTTPQLQDDVKYLQQLLNFHGQDVEADGMFGKGTEDAVKQFQKDNGLQADGIAGPSTWNALEIPGEYSEETVEDVAGDGGDSVRYSGRGSHSYPERGSGGSYEESASSGYPDRGAGAEYEEEETDSGSSGYDDRGAGTEYAEEETDSGSSGYDDRGSGDEYEEESSSGGYPDRDAGGSYPGRGSSSGGSYPGRGSSSGDYPDREGGSAGKPQPPPPKPPAPTPKPPPVSPQPPAPAKPGGSILYYPTLKNQDGFSDNNPHLNRDVRRMQTALNNAGFSTEADGMFGSGTESLVKDFQKKHGLTADGVAQSDTWKALERYSIPKAESPVLKYFWGDSNWVHNWEGHNGSAYWPGGSSGVTLDPGMDLGHADPSLIEDLYKPILTSDQYKACTRAFGIKGDAANQALKADPVLQSIRISREQADEIFDYAAVPYWDGIVNRFNTLIYPDTLATVQTALLSLSYNRGYGNSDLEQLRSPLERKDWWEVAERIGNMQQDHELEGIRKRRQAEGELIKWELNWLAEYV